MPRKLALHFRTPGDRSVGIEPEGLTVTFDTRITEAYVLESGLIEGLTELLRNFWDSSEVDVEILVPLTPGTVK